MSGIIRSCSRTCGRVQTEPETATRVSGDKPPSEIPETASRGYMLYAYVSYYPCYFFSSAPRASVLTLKPWPGVQRGRRTPPRPHHCDLAPQPRHHALRHHAVHTAQQYRQASGEARRRSAGRGIHAPCLGEPLPLPITRCTHSVTCMVTVDTRAPERGVSNSTHWLSSHTMTLSPVKSTALLFVRPR